MQLYFAGFEDFVFMGKDFFSGREHKFISVLQAMQTPLNILFGSFADVVFKCENAPLAIMGSIGVVGASLFYWNLYQRLMLLNRVDGVKMVRLALVCILCVCLQTSGEATMFTGVFPTSSFMYFYFLMASLSNNNHSGDYICK